MARAFSPRLHRVAEALLTFSFLSDSSGGMNVEGSWHAEP